MAPKAAPLRVLFLLTEVVANGGIQRFNRTILDSCRLLDIDCWVLSLNDSAALVAKYSKHDKLSLVGFSGDRRQFALAVAGALLRNRFDRVLVGHINLLTLAIAALALRVFHRPPTILIAHGIEVWRGIGRVRRYTLSRADRILCVSHYTRQRILEQAPALDAERLIIFPNALADTWKQVTPMPCARTAQGRFLLSVTRLERGDRYKGIATVIEAFSMLADQSLQYFVIGDGNDVPFLRLIAERCGVGDRVHFMHGVGDSELISLYQRCDAFVLPSGKEGFGIVFLEAMYFGAPVVAAHEKGAIDVVRDGETGISVPFGDTLAIKEAIERIGSDSALRERLRLTGRSTVIDGGAFTFARFMQRCADAFDIRGSIPV